MDGEFDFLDQVCEILGWEAAACSGGPAAVEVEDVAEGGGGVELFDGALAEGG